MVMASEQSINNKPNQMNNLTKIFCYFILIFLIFPSCKNESPKSIKGKFYDYEYGIFPSPGQESGYVAFPEIKPAKTDSELIRLAVHFSPILLGISIPNSASMKRNEYTPNWLEFSSGVYKVILSPVSLKDTNFVDGIFMYKNKK
jgi:hypothetical protein